MTISSTCGCEDRLETPGNAGADVAERRLLAPAVEGPGRVLAAVILDAFIVAGPGTFSGGPSASAPGSMGTCSQG